MLLRLLFFKRTCRIKKGYYCICTRYGAGSRDAMAERYVGVAGPR
jgi:hypothetical protein